jgi:hypothetical protein
MVMRLALPYQPKNMIDLNWKIHFLATVDRQQYASQLDELIRQLYSYEQPNGVPVRREMERGALSVSEHSAPLGRGFSRHEGLPIRFRVEREK